MNLLEGRIPTQIKEIALPASIGFFFSTLFNVVDTLFAGLISTEAVAALSLSFPIFFIIVAIVQGLSTGASALISNALGAKDESEAEHIAAQILLFGVLSYFVVVTIGLTFSTPLFEILGAHGEYLVLARTYMDIIFIGSIFFILLYAANSILFAHGNSKAMRNFLVGGSFLNAILDPWFLYGGLGVPAMGLRGIAFATVLTMLLGCIYIIYVIIDQGYMRVTHWKDFLPRGKILFAIAQQSFPATLNMMTIAIGIFVITYFVNPFGQAAIAAYGIGTRIEQLTLLPAIGLTVAAITMIGQNNGAGNFARIEEILTTITRYGLSIALFGFCFMSLLPEQLYMIFTRDEKVLAIGVPYLRIAALTSGAYILLSIHIAALQGMKRPNSALVIGLVRQIIFPISTFYILTVVLHRDLLAIWWSVCVIAWTAALLTVLYTRRVIALAKQEELLLGKMQATMHANGDS